MTIEYRQTKQQCQDNINGICSQCGGNLEPIETVDNSRNPTFWSGCKRCSRFDQGVDPRIYKIAKTMVEEYFFRPYHHAIPEINDSEETKQLYKEQQISGACSIVNQVLYLNKDLEEPK